MFHSFHEHFVPLFLLTEGEVPHNFYLQIYEGFFFYEELFPQFTKTFFSVESTSRKEPPLRVLWMTPSNFCLLPYPINLYPVFHEQHSSSKKNHGLNVDKFDDQFLFPLLNLAEAINTVVPSSLWSTLYLIFRIPIYLFQYLCYQQFTLDIF